MRAQKTFSSRLKSYLSGAALIVASLIGSSAFGAVTLISEPSGASHVELVLNKYYIYAGFAGSCTAGGVSETCDSCLGDNVVSPGVSGLVPCNRRNAYPSLRLYVQVDLGVSGLVESDIKFRIGGSTSYLSPSITPVVSGNTASITLTWSEICQAVVSGNSNCTTNINTTLGVGYQAAGETSGTFYDFQVVTRFVDTSSTTEQFYGDCSSNDGFCGYKIAPGDGKVYIDDLQWSSGYPATGAGGVEYSNLLFFFRETAPGNEATTIAEITNQDDYYSLVSAKDVEPPVEDDRVTGIENDKKYCFILANQDKTGIISRFAPNVASPVDPADVCASPAEVYGLLDNKKCFITTAAYGSPMAPEVQTFRDFRNQYLLGSEWGEAFVRSYYEHSPKYAKIIAHNDILRAGARGVLWPVLGLVKLTLHFGLIPVLTLFVSLLGGGIFVTRRRRQVRGEV